MGIIECRKHLSLVRMTSFMNLVIHLDVCIYGFWGIEPDTNMRTMSRDVGPLANNNANQSTIIYWKPKKNSNVVFWNNVVLLVLPLLYYMHSVCLMWQFQILNYLIVSTATKSITHFKSRNFTYSVATFLDKSYTI